MAPDEKEIEALESEIPAYCAEAAREAYRRALASGRPVLASGVAPDGGVAVYEISPDGARRVIKKIEPRTPVEPGRRIIIP